MPLTNCSECKFYDNDPNHSSDIRCGVSPAYATAYERLRNVDPVALNCLPLDNCREFEINPSFEKKEINLSLSVEQWQQFARVSNSSRIISDFLATKIIQHSLSLTIEDWQAIANSSDNSLVLDALAQHGIEPQQERWLDVDSSCIQAIAYKQLSSILFVRFHSGSEYQYLDVSSDVFDDFLHAHSKGSFFNNYIKDIYSYSSI